ncbi:hypothetical protein L1D14_07620 [Vibrio tubiashii]|uniref:hypothetical protein n=1 Tax=Vibrio tubiashii TaxID=29498 RepID=UPI001EFC9A66|nr:hypothetical protein [Vibrio tubiashii]MCG9576107.1 hypothetical protein [Vibrio tubiashii]
MKSNREKFYNVFQLTRNDFQVRIGVDGKRVTKYFTKVDDALKWRNSKYREGLLPRGLMVTSFELGEFSFSENLVKGYLQASVRTHRERKLATIRVYLSKYDSKRLAALDLFERYKNWLDVHNAIAEQYNNVRKNTFLALADEEEMNLWRTLPSSLALDVELWSRSYNAVNCSMSQSMFEASERDYRLPMRHE